MPAKHVHQTPDIIRQAMAMPVDKRAKAANKWRKPLNAQKDYKQYMLEHFRLTKSSRSRLKNSL